MSVMRWCGARGSRSRGRYTATIEPVIAVAAGMAEQETEDVRVRRDGPQYRIWIHALSPLTHRRVCVATREKLTGS